MRIKRYDISAEAIKFLFDGEEKHFKVIEGDIPKDAVLIRIWCNPYLTTPNIFSLFFVSDSFPDLKDGCVLPAKEIILKRLPDE